jgi:hypothetical protein
MAIKRQINWLGQQRVEVSDLRQIESGVANDFDILGGRVLTNQSPQIVSGLTITTAGVLGKPATNLVLNVAGAIILHPLASESGTFFTIDDSTPAELLSSTNTNVVGGFAAASINYVGLDLIRKTDSTTNDLTKFMDADTGEEFSRIVPKARLMKYRIIIQTQPFSDSTNVLPIAKVVTTAANDVDGITDTRNLMFRLAPGGDSPNSAGFFDWPDREENPQTYDVSSALDPFAGGDKSLVSLKDWINAMATSIWENRGGEYWYSNVARDNVQLLYGSVGILSDNFEWSSPTLKWEGLKIAFENSTGWYNTIADDTVGTTVNDGQCLYVDIVRESNASINAVVGTLANLGDSTIPGRRVILAWRIGTEIGTRGGIPFIPASGVATNLVQGTVKLNIAATVPADPVVPVYNGGFVIGTGVSRQGTGAGLFQVGTNANDTSVQVAGTGVDTTLGGDVYIDGQSYDLKSSPAVNRTLHIPATEFVAVAGNPTLQVNANGDGYNWVTNALAEFTLMAKVLIPNNALITDLQYNYKSSTDTTSSLGLSGYDKVGYITGQAGAAIADGETITLFDGNTTYTLEFDQNPPLDGVAGGNIAVVFANADTKNQVSTAIANAINGMGSYLAAAVNGLDDVVITHFGAFGAADISLVSATFTVFSRDAVFTGTLRSLVPDMINGDFTVAAYSCDGNCVTGTVITNPTGNGHRWSNATFVPAPVAVTGDAHWTLIVKCPATNVGSIAFAGVRIDYDHTEIRPVY